MIKVLIVEDSAVVREFLAYILGADSDIAVIGTAANGEEAIEFLKSKKPDVITMDINMPRMDGFVATRKIMESHPTPIVIVSGSWSKDEVAMTFRAVEAGALAMVARPSGIGHPEHETTILTLIQTVKLMSEVKVVRRWPRSQSTPSKLPSLVAPRANRELQPVAMGASTGGPLVLQAILSGITKDFSLPVLIVQHMAAGFIEGFVHWLAQSSNFPVHVAVHGQVALPGHAYLAPDGCQMRADIGSRIALTKDEPENGLRPSVSYLFRSVASVFGKSAVGVLLTGMGKDGAEELKLMRGKGAVTIVQDKETAVVYGMPGKAVELDAACHVLSPDRIAAELKRLAGKNDSSAKSGSFSKEEL